MDKTFQKKWETIRDRTFHVVPYKRYGVYAGEMRRAITWLGCELPPPRAEVGVYMGRVQRGHNLEERRNLLSIYLATFVILVDRFSAQYSACTMCPPLIIQGIRRRRRPRCIHVH